MRISFYFCVLFLLGCATNNPQARNRQDGPAAPEIAASDSSLPDGLGRQVLAPSECGLFAWDHMAEPRFIFFATENTALYAPRGSPARALSPQDAFPSTRYGPVQLTLGPPEAMVDGIRYASARLKETLEDGFTRIQPVIVLQTCQKLEIGSG